MNKADYHKNKIAYHQKQLEKLGETTEPNTQLKVTKVSYGRTYNTGNYTSERIEFEAEVSPSDNLQEVVNQLDTLCYQKSFFGTQQYQEAIQYFKRRLEKNDEYSRDINELLSQLLENIDYRKHNYVAQAIVDAAKKIALYENITLFQVLQRLKTGFEKYLKTEEPNELDI
jgi:hypothetical protein